MGFPNGGEGGGGVPHLGKIPTFSRFFIWGASLIEDADFADGRPVSGSLCAHLDQPGENEVSCRCLPRHTFDLHTITITKSYLDLNISFLVPLLLSFSSSTSSALSIAALTAQWTAWSPPGPPGTLLPASAACSSQT